MTDDRPELLDLRREDRLRAAIRRHRQEHWHPADPERNDLYHDGEWLDLEEPDPDERPL